MTRLSISIPDATNHQLRTFLGMRGGKKGDISLFIEQAIREQMARITLQEVRQKNAHIDPEIIMADVEEAVRAARAPRS